MSTAYQIYNNVFLMSVIRIGKNFLENTRPVSGGSSQQQLEQTAEKAGQGLSVMLALYTGMRIGEICALRWQDMDLEAGMIQVRRTLQRIPEPVG